MLTDGLAGDQQEIVRGAYDVAGSVIPLVGDCAGDDLAMAATQQLYGREVFTDAASASRLDGQGFPFACPLPPEDLVRYAHANRLLVAPR